MRAYAKVRDTRAEARERRGHEERSDPETRPEWVIRRRRRIAHARQHRAGHDLRREQQYDSGEGRDEGEKEAVAAAGNGTDRRSAQLPCPRTRSGEVHAVHGDEWHRTHVHIAADHAARGHGHSDDRYNDRQRQQCLAHVREKGHETPLVRRSTGGQLQLACRKYYRHTIPDTRAYVPDGRRATRS